MRPHRAALIALALLSPSCGAEMIYEAPSSDTECSADPPTAQAEERIETMLPTIWRDVPLLERRSSPPVSLALELDACDDPSYEGASWESSETTHFTFHYFAGTTAERDIGEIGRVRERSYAELGRALGLAELPHIDLYLSPSRHAASVHGRAFGTAYPGADRYEVVYTGDPDGYESTHYGHELTHLLAHYVVREGERQLPLLSEGIAEYFDRSGRDLHAAYARRLDAHAEARVRLAELDSGDVWGRNRGRAGSLVAFLVEAHGVPTLVELLRETSVRWSGGCNRHRELGCIDTPSSVEELLDHALLRVSERGWPEQREEWWTRVRAALDRNHHELEGDARGEVERLLHEMDLAVATGDPERYRATMDGFYCVWLDETGRRRVAARSVAGFGATSTSLVALHPTGTKNFPSARAFVIRTDERGVTSVFTIHLERFAVGWRVTYGPDWQ